MLLSVPTYDRYFVPLMRRKIGNPRGISLLQRLGIGFVIQSIAIGIAYVVEVQRRHVIRVHHIVGPQDVVPMSIFWLLPQYVLIGVADVFNAIGLLEFFYDQSLEEIFLVTMVDKITGRGAHKSWIGDNLNDSHLDYYYGFLLVISTLNLGAFFWASSKYEYKRETNKEVDGGCIQIQVDGGCIQIQMEGKTLETSPLG
ncbi:hypothetical protein SLEP1_g5180 [Rubroshorea leprosula]|uniref:Uncharacterized protein n=1 Tax=Rubroshorea leprosula TaxID=152421 RepID=A0AAV5I0Y2_9ROSI|nr:hypothetical protein SLEP1_g5180 [Rubroshorea leprosula]